MPIAIGTYTVGSGKDYATMKAAWADISSCGLSGDLTFVIHGTVEETGSNPGFAFPDVYLNGHTVTIQGAVYHNGEEGVGSLWYLKGDPMGSNAYTIGGAATHCDLKGRFIIKDIRIKINADDYNEIKLNATGQIEDFYIQNVLCSMTSIPSNSSFVLFRLKGDSDKEKQFVFYNIKATTCQYFIAYDPDMNNQTTNSVYVENCSCIVDATTSFSNDGSIGADGNYADNITIINSTIQRLNFKGSVLIKNSCYVTGTLPASFATGSTGNLQKTKAQILSEFISDSSASIDFAKLKNTSSTIGVAITPSPVSGVAPLAVSFAPTVSYTYGSSFLSTGGTAPMLTGADIKGDTYRNPDGSYPIGCFAPEVV